MSLRKEKAARLKLAILDQTLKLIGRRPFDDLYVEDICLRVKISKVTLFKYFPIKEDILAYYFRVWCLRRTVELKEKPKEGVQGVYFLFDKLSEDFDQHPGIVLSLVAYLSSPKRPPKPFPLKAEEKKLLFPEVPDIASVEIMSIEQLMEKFALEGVFRKEFTKTSNTRDIMHLLMTLFFGSLVTLQLTQVSPTKQFMRRLVESAIKGLQ
ncbi:MAG: TetR/AcrR family transcriptional regulator [Cyclobacteriaceae bacterium]|nr:TetR/AcrR family transcriptional regulator [Cyclobacteriaceae bacterium]